MVPPGENDASRELHCQAEQKLSRAFGKLVLLPLHPIALIATVLLNGVIVALLLL